MALASAAHSDDEYGWDLSLEEEEELLATISDTTFAPTNVTATPRNPVRRPAGSPGSGGSSSTIRTALRRPIARLPSTAPADTQSLKADINAAFPKSPRTVTVTDNDSVSETESPGRRSPHRHGEDTPVHPRLAVCRGSRKALEAPEDDEPEPVSPGSYVAEDVSYPDCKCGTISIYLPIDRAKLPTDAPASRSSSDPRFVRLRFGIGRQARVGS